jgi:hypothetical protein
VIAAIVLRNVGESLVALQGLVGFAIGHFDVGQKPAQHTGQIQTYRTRRHVVDARIAVFLDLKVEEVEATWNEKREPHGLTRLEFYPVLAHEFIESGVRDDHRLEWNARFAARTAGIVLLEYATTVSGAPQALGVAATCIDEGEIRLLPHVAVSELLACEGRPLGTAAVRDDARLAHRVEAAQQMRFDVEQLTASRVTGVAGKAQIFGVQWPCDYGHCQPQRTLERHTATLAHVTGTSTDRNRACRRTRNRPRPSG